MMNSLHLAKTTMTLLLLFIVAIATAKTTGVKSLRSAKRVPSRSLTDDNNAASTNSADCPKSRSSPRSGDSCTLKEFERCEYDPHVRCPNDPPIYIYACECFGGEFACLSHAMTPCDDEEERETREGENQFHILPHYPEEEPTEKEPKTKEEENDEFHTLPFPDVKEEPKTKEEKNDEVHILPHYPEESKIVHYECPKEQPQENVNCSGLPSSCDYGSYHPEHCPEQSFPKYSCFCELGGFTCVINEVTICPVTEPKSKPKPEPEAPVSTVCPRSYPLGSKIFVKCDMESNIACNYKPVRCNDFVHYSQQCFCDKGGFQCIESAIACEAPKEEPPKQVTVCPLSDPMEDNMFCNMDEHITCNYKPITCNEYEYYTQKCFCEGGKFNCLVNMIVCEEPKEPEPKVPVATVCPQSAPSDPKNMMCDMNSETACNYDPLDCASSLLYGTTCTCRDGHFSCISPRMFCPEPQTKCKKECSNEPSDNMKKNNKTCDKVFANKKKRKINKLKQLCKKLNGPKNNGDKRDTEFCLSSCSLKNYIDVECCHDATE